MNRVGVMVGVIGLAATGCGGDGSGGSSGGDGAAVTQPAASSDGADAQEQTDSNDPPGGASDVASTDYFAAPCSVLDEGAVADATGLVVTASEDRGAEGCRWYVERVDPDILADDAISWQPFRAEQFAFQKDALDQGLEGETIGGLGNDALFVGGTVGEVWVLLDDLSFRVGNQFAFRNVDGRAAQEALAKSLADVLG